MKASKEVSYRCVAGEHMLIPVGTAAQENNGLIVLNEVGAKVWELLLQEKNPDEMADAIAAEYDADVHTIREDVQEMLEHLKSLGLVHD